MARQLSRERLFNRDAEFTALRPLTVQGRRLRPGDPVDKSLFTTRRLRCLYEQRVLEMAPPISIPAHLVSHMGQSNAAS